MSETAGLALAFLDGRDEFAFRALYRAATPSAYGLALRLAGGDAAEAAEVVQEAWVRALERVDRFDGGAWTPWLRGFVVNCWRERVRRRTRRMEADLPDDQPAGAGGDPADPLVDAAAVRAAVLALPDRYRAVLLLHDVEGYTHDEIAALLGIVPGTSKSQLARARAALRASLGETERAPGRPADPRDENTLVDDTRRDAHDATR